MATPRRADDGIRGPIGLAPVACALVLLGQLFACTVGAATQRVDLRALAVRQQDFAGDLVRTTGSVVRFVDGGDAYYVLQDAEQDRVELLPAVRAARYEGQRVTVTGRFDVSPTIGRYLQIERIQAVTQEVPTG